MDALFILTRQLATQTPVTDVAAPKWLVQRHGLAPLTARAGAASYREDLARATLEWARTERALPPIVNALQRAGVRVAPIKGAAYAMSIYAVPAERPMSDVDLLIGPGQLEAAERVLAELGWEAGPAPVLHHAHAWVNGDLALDLHRDIIAPGRSRIDLDAIWSRTTPGWPSGAERLEPSDALAFHLVHLARNRLNLPLINVIDTARLLAHGADAAIALARARTWGLGAATSLALRFCTSILERDHERPIGWLGPSRAAIAELVEPSTANKVLFDLATAGSPRQLAARIVHFAANQARRIRRAQ